MVRETGGQERREGRRGEKVRDEGVVYIEKRGWLRAREERVRVRENMAREKRVREER